MEPFRCDICEFVRYEFAAKLDESVCCTVCAEDHDGPGQYEAYAGNLENLGKCLILNEWSMNGMEDEWMSSEGWGYCALMGKFLFQEDDRGFKTFIEHENEDAARKEFDELYEVGWGAMEDDAYINFDRGRWYVQFNGEELKVRENKNGEITQRRCLAAVRLEMFKKGYYPNVWIVGERGDLNLVRNV